MDDPDDQLAKFVARLNKSSDKSADVGSSVDLTLALAKLGAKPKDGERPGNKGVDDSPDFQRIYVIDYRDHPHSLPGGTWHGNLDIDLTFKFRKPGGTWSLRPLQNRAIYEAGMAGGALILLPVGEGKTLVSLLVGEELEARKILLLVPANLKIQLLEEDIPKYGQHFNIPKLGERLFIHSHNALSDPRTGPELLKQTQPDLIIIDEAHRFRYKNTTRVGRMAMYLRDHPNTRVVLLSGTLTNSSLKDYGHMAWWALGLRSPLPIDTETLAEWAGAIDPPKPGDFPIGPGVLKKFCIGDEDVRLGFQRRLTGTVGVVNAPNTRLGVDLVVNERTVDVPQKIEELLDRVNKAWCRPDGEEFEDVLTKHRMLRQLSCGFWYKWDWPHGIVDTEWLEARRAMHKRIRERLKFHTPGMDSPFLLFAAAERGRLWKEGKLHEKPASMWLEKDGSPIQEYMVWRNVKDRDPPPTIPVWEDDFLVNEAVQWGKESPGIIWYLHRTMGEEIAKRGGFPLYGPGEKAGAGLIKENAQAKEGRPRTVVASLKAHGTGKNLQGWNRMLFVECMSNGATWEQALGRSHRQGQDANEVRADVFLHTTPMQEAFASALRQAKYIESTLGQAQKLNYASTNILINLMDFDTSLLDSIGKES